MKTQLQTKSTERGSVLLVTLVTAVIIGTALASFLLLVQNQSASVGRSQTWNGSMIIAEAGLEDGLQFINKYAASPNVPGWTNSYAADNWSRNASVYNVRRYVGGSYYDVYVTNFVSGPGLCSIGYVASPNSTNSTLVRKVVVKTAKDALFNYALAAKGTVNFNGNNTATDSFDSSDPNYSTNGVYIASKRKNNGDVLTNDAITNSNISVGNAKINGHVNTGPSGDVTVGPNGSVGDVAWVAGGNTGIQTGFANPHTMNVQFPDVSSPDITYNSPWWNPFAPSGQSITINGTTTAFGQAYTTGGNNYYKLSSLPGKIYVGTNVNVVIWVTGSISMAGSDQIDIAQGGTLTLYVGNVSGSSVSFSMAGNSTVNNYSKNAQNFMLLGLPTCTGISMNGNAAVTGVVYSPQADMSLGGGGNTTYDFVGSIMAKTVTLSGHMNFHFDEALKNSSYSRGYIVTDWKEGT